MIQAVIFDMFETLITHYKSPLYFGTHMARDAGISDNKFQPLWQATESDRSIGKITLEQVLEMILRKNECYSKELLENIAKKRMEAKRECFKNMHKEIIPMLSKIKEKGILIGLISNCYSEEAKAIRESELFPYFDAVFLSCEQGIQKPDKRIFKYCMEKLSVKPEDCLYIGDGGSYELETAQDLGMKAIQATWYFQKGIKQVSKRNDNFVSCGTPLTILNYLEPFYHI